MTLAARRLGVRRPRLGGPAAWVAAVAPLVGGCGAEESAPAERGPSAPTPVTVVEVQRLTVPEFVAFTGTLVGVEQVALAAEVGGRLEEVAADLGDVVANGAVLARIAPIDFELARDERERALAQRLAALGLDALPAENFDVEQLPAVVRARLEQENAERRYERSRGLAESRTSAISEQALADLRTAAEVASSELTLARLEVAGALAEARTLDAQLSVAARRLEQTVVRAPEGSDRRWAVAERLVAAGDSAREGDVLFRLIDTDPVLLRGPLPQRHFGTVRPGQTVEVELPGGGLIFRGELARVAPSIDVATRSFTIEVRVPNPDGLLAPGAFALGRVVIGSREGLFAPAETVASFAGVQRVFAVLDGVAHERRVTTGAGEDGRVELIGQLQAGEMLVVSPPARLVDGTALEVRAEAAPTRP